MLKSKFVEWLRKMPETKGHGERTEIAGMTGLKRPYVSQLLNGKSKGDIGLYTIQTIADHWPCEPWEVLWMVHHGVYQLPPTRGPRRR